MTKFEQVGINYQYLSATKEDAIKSFDFSCKCCCNTGMHLECDRCAIAYTHNMVVACFDDKNE